MQNCPKCQSKTDVYDSRLSMEGEFRRKRKCKNVDCGFRYATIEVLDSARPLDKEPREAKPKAAPRPKKIADPKKVKQIKERRVRKFEDYDDYVHGGMDRDIQDVARDLGIGDFT
jgi:hypothetical protein